jgi:putative membrane protein
MRIDRTLPLKLLWAAYAVMWVGGVLKLRDPGWAAPAFLWIAGAIALLSGVKQRRALLSAAAIGFAFEAIGLRTGLPFGAYEYTGRLGFALLGVPVAIACAWMVLFAFVRQYTAKPAIGAALLTATDLLIDPVASQVLGYWRWVTPGVYFGVPLLNFVGWFIAGVTLFLANPGPAARSRSLQLLGASILLFFALRALPAG